MKYFFAPFKEYLKVKSFSSAWWFVGHNQEKIIGVLEFRKPDMFWHKYNVYIYDMQLLLQLKQEFTCKYKSNNLDKAMNFSYNFLAKNKYKMLSNHYKTIL